MVRFKVEPADSAIGVFANCKVCKIEFAIIFCLRKIYLQMSNFIITFAI